MDEIRIRFLLSVKKELCCTYLSLIGETMHRLSMTCGREPET
jgi:hypothetical protein